MIDATSNHTVQYPDDNRHANTQLSKLSALQNITNAGIAACTARYCVNNIYASAGRFQTGIAFKDALDLRLSTTFSQTGAALSAVVTTYAVNHALRQALDVPEDGSMQSSAIFCSAAALGGVASHPFTAPFYMPAVEQYKSSRSISAPQVAAKIWKNHRTQLIRAIPARAFCTGSDFGLYFSLRSLLHQHGKKIGIENQPTIEIISSGLSQIPSTIAHQHYINILNTPTLAPITPLECQKSLQNVQLPTPSTTTKPTIIKSPIFSARYIGPFAIFYIAAAAKISLTANIKDYLDAKQTNKAQ